MLSETTLHELVAHIAKDYPIARVVLFGSFARGEATESSDIDLLVDSDRGFTLINASSFRNRLMEAVGLPVDIVGKSILNSSEFGEAIQREGRVIYERDL